MQEIYFLTRHIPFWGVPLMLLGAEFAYLFWLKKQKSNAYFSILLGSIGFFAICFYVWAGGPEKSVKIIKKMHRDHLSESTQSNK